MKKGRNMENLRTATGIKEKSTLEKKRTFDERGGRNYEETKKM